MTNLFFLFFSFFSFFYFEKGLVRRTQRELQKRLQQTVKVLEKQVGHNNSFRGPSSPNPNPLPRPNLHLTAR